MRQKRCGFADQGETQQPGIAGQRKRGVSEEHVESVIGQAGGAASSATVDGVVKQDELLRDE